MKKQNFTMTELLVVMAIIMILAGLVFPAVSSSRTTAKAAACLSNQKQVVTAIIQSMNANKTRFYSPTYTGTDNDVDDTTVRWTARLKNRKYLPEYQVMRCTEVLFPPAKKGSFGDDAFTYGAVHHATSETGGFDFRGTKFLRDSSKKDVAPTRLMLGACSWNTANQGGALLDVANATTDEDAYGTMARVHRESANIFFLDGRAAPYSLNELESSPIYYPSFDSGYAVKFDKSKTTTGLK